MAVISVMSMGEIHKSTRGQKKAGELFAPALPAEKKSQGGGCQRDGEEPLAEKQRPYAAVDPEHVFPDTGQADLQIFYALQEHGVHIAGTGPLQLTQEPGTEPGREKACQKQACLCKPFPKAQVMKPMAGRAQRMLFFS